MGKLFVYCRFGGWTDPRPTGSPAGGNGDAVVAGFLPSRSIVYNLCMPRTGDQRARVSTVFTRAMGIQFCPSLGFRPKCILNASRLQEQPILTALRIASRISEDEIQDTGGREFGWSLRGNFEVVANGSIVDNKSHPHRVTFSQPNQFRGRKILANRRCHSPQQHCQTSAMRLV